MKTWLKSLAVKLAVKYLGVEKPRDLYDFYVVEKEDEFCGIYLNTLVKYKSHEEAVELGPRNNPGKVRRIVHLVEVR